MRCLKVEILEFRTSVVFFYFGSAYYIKSAVHYVKHSYTLFPWILMKILVGQCYYILAQGYSRNNKLQSPNSNQALSDSSGCAPAQSCSQMWGRSRVSGFSLAVASSLERSWVRGGCAWPWSWVHVRWVPPERELCAAGSGKTVRVSDKASMSHVEIQGPVDAHQFQSW